MNSCGEDVQDFAVFGKRDVAGGIDGAAHVIALNVAWALTQRDAAAAIDSADVPAGNSDQRFFHWYIRDALGLFDRATDGTHRGIEIDDQALAQVPWTRPRRAPETSPVRLRVRNQHARFVLPISSPYQVFIFLRQAAAPGINLSFPCRGRYRAGFGIHDHLPRILQIDRLHAAGIGLPTAKIVDQHFVFAGKFAGTEVDGYGLRVVWRSPARSITTRDPWDWRGRLR